MIYDIRQTTSYSYASTVSYSRHVLRLTPVDRPGQRVHASALEIEPAPVGRREGADPPRSAPMSPALSPDTNHC